MFWMSIVVFFAGVVVYAIGISLNPNVFSNWVYVIPTSILSSLGMFLYQDDISELTECMKQDTVYMAWYSSVHFLAALITSAVIIKLIGRRIIYLCRMYYISHWVGHIEELYVLWGINERSVALASSSYEYFKRNGKQDSLRIVFVHTDTYNDMSDMEFNINRFFDIIHLTEENHACLKKTNALITHYHGLLGEQLHLTMLGKLIRKSSIARFFFFSDNEDDNIAATEELIKQYDDTTKPLHIYCHAHSSAKTHWMENYEFIHQNSNFHFHVIDSSRLSIYELKRNPLYHPIVVVDKDEQTATVKGEFRSMVIGFGETGNEAFRYLYEFGAFVGIDGKRIPFNCTVIDQGASEKCGLLEAYAPLLKMEYKDCVIDSSAYWDTVKRALKQGLRYVVIATGNDDTALDAAVNLCTIATRLCDEDTPILKVYVRSYLQANFVRMKTVADDFNKRLRNKEIIIFGSSKQIFSYDIIINEIYTELAINYHIAYEGKLDEINKKGITDEKYKERMKWWKKGIGLISIKDGKEYIKIQDDSTLSEIEEVIRKRDQNISNSLHAATKIQMLESTGIKLEKWKTYNFTRKQVGESWEKSPEYIYITDQRIRTILHNVARLEHERWVAASVLQGEQLPPDPSFGKDKVRKYHTDLVSWDNVRLWDEKDHLVTQGYDCCVVETSILQQDIKEWKQIMQKYKPSK